MVIGFLASAVVTIVAVGLAILLGLGVKAMNVSAPLELCLAVLGGLSIAALLIWVINKIGGE